MNRVGAGKTELKVLTIVRQDRESPAEPHAYEEAKKVHPASKWSMAIGVFLLALSIYVLTSPGRIDIIDGQTRFDVAYNWLVEGRPILQDTWISGYMGVRGRDGLLYSYYGAPGSVFAMPLVLVALCMGPAIEPIQFLFSLTASIFGAGIAAVLFLFYLELGVGVRRALKNPK